MDRRTFLSALTAAPIVGGAVAPTVGVDTVEVRSFSLPPLDVESWEGLSGLVPSPQTFTLDFYWPASITWTGDNPTDVLAFLHRHGIDVFCWRCKTEVRAGEWHDCQRTS